MTYRQRRKRTKGQTYERASKTKQEKDKLTKDKRTHG